tara:strand:+ start:6705 stop:7277 length:573 start_codon:yes stop_codon:yes gene_type:complete
MSTVSRCQWCGDSDIYQQYHDTEWGLPLYDEQQLFEFLLLEGAQAGLSWITILKKREGYRQAFDNFDAVKIAAYDRGKIAELLLNPNIVRNNLKVNSAIKNARAFVAMQKSGESFVEFIWNFVGGQPRINQFKKISDIPATTPESDAMSKALKIKGFNFVGSTICYAFMQATGMVNDHVVSCFRFKQCQR